MAQSPAARLVRLGDTERTVADPAEDVRGFTVQDADGQELGVVDDLLVDEAEGRVRLLEVRHGGVLGFASTSTFVPVEAVVQVDGDDVRIDQRRDRVADAPRYDPDLAEDDHYAAVYGYYGYPPLGTAGYVPPVWPRRGPGGA